MRKVGVASSYFKINQVLMTIIFPGQGSQFVGILQIFMIISKLQKYFEEIQDWQKLNLKNYFENEGNALNIFNFINFYFCCFNVYIKTIESKKI